MPNASDVDRVERDLLAALRLRCSAARSAPSTTSSRRIAARRPRPAAGRAATPSGRSSCARASPRAAPRRARPLAPAPPGFADALLRRSASSSQGCVEPGRPRRRARARSTPPTAPSSTGSGSGIATGCAGARPSALAPRPRRLARRAGLRLRLRGPDRRRVGAARGARGARRGDVSLPYEPGRAAFASLRAHGRRPRRARRRTRSRSCRRARRVRAPCARPPRARAVRGRRRRPPPPLGGRDPLPRGRRRRAARSSSSARSSLALLRGGVAPERVALVAPSLERVARAARDGARRLEIPYAVEARVRLAATPLGHALLALLRFAWSEAAARELYGFLRSPYSGLARSPVDYVEGRLRGRAVAGAGARRGGDRAAPRGAAPGARRAARGRRRRSRPCASWRASMLRRRLRPRGAAGRRDVARSTSARYGARRRAARRARGLGAARRAGRPATTWSPRSSGPRCGSRRRGEAGRVAVLDLLRARTRRFDVVFVLGLEEGTLAAARARLAVPRRRRAARPRAAARGSSGPTRSAATATSSTRPARARRGGSYLVREAATDDGAPARAEPVLGRGAPLFDAERRRARDRRRPLSALTWPLEAAPTERERLRALAALAVAEPRRALPRSPRRTAGSGASARPRARSDRPTAPARPACSGSARGRRSASPSWSVSPTARRPGCRAHRLAEDDRRRGRRDAARLGRPQRPAQVLRGPAEGAGPRPRDARRTSSARSGSCAGASTTRSRRGPARPDRAAARPSSTRGCGATSRASSATRRARRSRSSRGASRSRSAPTARRPSCSAGSTLGDGLFAQRQDRPDRRRPVQRARDRPGLQVGPHGALGEADRRGAAAADPALHARAARPRRDRAARRRLPRARRRPASPGACCTRARDGRPAGLPAQRLPDEDEFWSLVETSRDRARGYAERIRAGDVRHDPKGGECPAWCDLWPMCRVRAHMNAEQARRSRPEGRGLRLGGRRHREDLRARRAVRARRLRGGARRRVGARDHLHRARPPASCAPASARALRARGRHDLARRARRRLDLDDPRLLLAAAACAPVRGRDRPALPGARRRAGRGRARRGLRAGARRVLRRARP